jgi:ribosome-associated toxin RatA of RatAB toxin-antitoxin module
MSKEIENKECQECESSYRLVYNLDDTSGYPKFCPFCSAEIYKDEEEQTLHEEDS